MADTVIPRRQEEKGGGDKSHVLKDFQPKLLQESDENRQKKNINIEDEKSGTMMPPSEVFELFTDYRRTSDNILTRIANLNSMLENGSPHGDSRVLSETIQELTSECQSVPVSSKVLSTKLLEKRQARLIRSKDHYDRQCQLIRFTGADKSEAKEPGLGTASQTTDKTMDAVKSVNPKVSTKTQKFNFFTKLWNQLFTTRDRSGYEICDKQGDQEKIPTEKTSPFCRFNCFKRSQIVQ